MNEYEAEAGEYFMHFVERSKSSLKEMGCSYGRVRFNGIDFIIYPDSNSEDIETIYNLKKEIYRLKTNKD